LMQGLRHGKRVRRERMGCRDGNGGGGEQSEAEESLCALPVYV
jgi:hypothetical protein